MSLSRRLLLTAAVLALVATPVLADEWSYTDGSGKTVTLDHVPNRIIAHISAAQALIANGIRPVGIYLDSPLAETKGLETVDVSGIEIVGDKWGEINIEKVAALKPDLIVAEYWPLEKAYSGLENEVIEKNGAIESLAPIAGPAQGDSIVKLIEDYAVLAKSLGGDTDARLENDKAAFEAAVERFKAALADKPDLLVMAVSPTAETLYVAAPAGASELMDFERWGMRLVTPEIANDRGYWETLSWENFDKYHPDLVIIDDRWGWSDDKAGATWKQIKAVAAGATAPWPAYWIRTYADYARELDKLTTAIEAADPSTDG